MVAEIKKKNLVATARLLYTFPYNPPPFNTLSIGSNYQQLDGLLLLLLLCCKGIFVYGPRSPSHKLT